MAPPPTAPRKSPTRISRGPVVFDADGSVAVVLSRCRAGLHPTEVRQLECLSSLATSQFATPAATPAEGRCPMVTGQGLIRGPRSRPRPFRRIGRLLARDGRARAAYDELVSAPASSILSVGRRSASILSTPLLPRTARGMRRYPRATCSENWSSRLHDGARRAICHGVCRARSTNPRRSIRPLRQQTTALTWSLERGLRWCLTRFWDRLLPHLREEAGSLRLHVGRTGVTRRLERPRTSWTWCPDPDAAMKSSGRVRDTRRRAAAFVVADGSYTSALARRPHTFAESSRTL